MRTPISVLLLIVFVTSAIARAAAGQTQQANVQATVPQKASAPILVEDTPVRLRLMQNLTSATAKLNDKVDFEVIEPVKVNEAVVIEQGATAIATVTKASSKKSFGRSGKLDVNIDYVRLVSGEKVNLRAVKGGSGASRTGVMTGAVVATAIVFFPAAPLFFFIKGKNIEIPKGTEITAYIAADTPVNLPTQSSEPPLTQKTTAQTADALVPTDKTPTMATLVIKSDPSGAEITIDERFVGTTQSTLKISAGEHSVTITKTGYKDWKRNISLNAGSDITIDAILEKTPQ